MKNNAKFRKIFVLSFLGLASHAMADVKCSISLHPDFSSSAESISFHVRNHALEVFSNLGMGQKTRTQKNEVLTNMSDNPLGIVSLDRGCNARQDAKVYYVRFMDGTINAGLRDCATGQEARYYGLGDFATLTVTSKGYYDIWKDQPFPYDEVVLSCR